LAPGGLFFSSIEFQSAAVDASAGPGPAILRHSSEQVPP